MPSASQQIAQTNNVDRIYRQVRTMASAFQLKPEERINEKAI
jgi:hypothetical protein